jgi:putative ABC transport system permease protein
MLQGRSFSREFKDDDTKIILNESAVKKMQLESPVGKMIKTGSSESQVIGIVKDFQYGSLHQFIQPLIFRFRSPRVGSHVLVKLQAGAGAETIRQIESQYKAFHPKYPFEFSFLDEDYQSLYTSELKMSKLSRYFAGLAILIACLGLFGLAAFSAQKRQKEIAIRKVLGASVQNVFILLTKDFMKLILLAALIAFPLAWWSMNKWLLGFAYRVEIRAEVFLLTLAMLTMITWITVGFQALKAAVTNPGKSLKWNE